MWQLSCDFYASRARVYASQLLPPVYIPDDDGPCLPDVENTDLTCDPERQCPEHADCGTGNECVAGCCYVIIR